MTAKIYLSVVTDASPDKDAIFESSALPLFRGEEEDESLACGGCKAIIGQHISTRTLYNKFVVDNRLVLRCPCGADNVVPATKL